MKIKGKTLVQKNRIPATLYRHTGEDNGKPQFDEFTFVLTPLPMGWHKQMTARMPPPNDPPPIAVTDKDGKPVINPETNRIEFVDNTKDAKFRQSMIEWNRRMDALRLAAYLRDDTNVEFECVPPKPKGEEKEANHKKWAEYADTLLKEIEEAGFTEDEVIYLLEKAESLGLVVNLEEASKYFLSHQATPETGTES